MSVAATLARFIRTADAARLPASAVAAARGAINDAIACALAGAREDAAAILRRVLRANGQGGPASLIGGGGTASMPDAAFANGVAGHALDYDDVMWTMYGHPTVAILPAALAVAEAKGRSGRDLVAAYMIGVEVAGKIGRWANPAHYEHGWHSTATIGVLGAAAAAARLLDLDEHRIVMALGIAASEAAGVRRNFGTMTKPFHAGNAARAGVIAAQLAEAGFTADATALDGRFGWFETLSGRAVPPPAELDAALGKPWEVEEPGIALKLYPACAATHCAIDAMLEIRNEARFGAGDIESVSCASHPLAGKVLLYARPTTGLEGKFSMQYCLAVAAIDGAPALKHFSAAWIGDRRVQSLLPRIAFEQRANLAQLPSADGVPAEVTVTLRGGREHRRTVTVPSGDPRKPMSDGDRARKFAECAAGVIAAPDTARLWDSLESLDRAPALAPLCGALRGA